MHVLSERDLTQGRMVGIVAVALVIVGIGLVYGASSIHAVELGRPGWYFAFKQLLAAVLGGILLVVCAKTDYHVWQDELVTWSLLAVATIGLVIVVLPFTHGIAPVVNGARRWIRIGPLSIQPSDVATLAAVMWTAMLATKREKMLGSFREGLSRFLVVLVPLTGLIVIQPDLSTAARLALLTGIVVFTAGARIGHFLLVALASLPFFAWAIIAEPYRLERVTAFLKMLLSIFGIGEETTAALGWQMRQSLLGIGSGQLFGLGPGEGLQKLGYLPHAASDFLFSTIGEEYGFVGVVVTLTLYTLYVVLGLRVAKTAADRFGMLLATGVTALVGLTAALHIAVTLGIMPTTGLPLPLLSYGGTHLVVALIATGILINIAHQRPAR